MSGTVANNLERSSGTIGAAGSGITVDSGDPAIDSNPAGGVGTVWSNSTSGETYVCTDATAGANIWTNVGDGTGSITLYAGSQYGFCCGGYSPTRQSVIDIVSFSSDGDATAHGDLAIYGTARGGGTNSATHGYISGGNDNTTKTDRTEKYEFASSSDGSDVSNLTVARSNCVGTNNASHGYIGGGYSPSTTHIVDKFAFASDSDSTKVGDMTTNHYYGAGNSSLTYGYEAGGATTSEADTNIIEKWSFTSDGNSADVGDITANRAAMRGSSSSDHGYFHGGYQSGTRNEIERYAFASDGNSVDVGDLAGTTHGPAGASQIANGYSMGRDNGGALDDMYKYAYASSSDGAFIGNVTIARHHGCGNHY